MSASALLRKWRHQLDRVRHEQLRDLLLHRRIFHQMNECCKPYIGNMQGAELQRWMTHNYVAFAATAIRKMMEGPRYGAISLRNLMEDLAKNESLLTLDRQRRMYRGSGVEEFADRNFAEMTRSKSAKRMSASRIRRDLRELQRVCKPVLQVANTIIAHTESDRRRIGRMTYEQIDVAIDALARAYARYEQLITGSPTSMSDTVDVRHDLRRIWPPK